MPAVSLGGLACSLLLISSARVAVQTLRHSKTINTNLELALMTDPPLFVGCLKSIKIIGRGPNQLKTLMLSNSKPCVDTIDASFAFNCFIQELNLTERFDRQSNRSGEPSLSSGCLTFMLLFCYKRLQKTSIQEGTNLSADRGSCNELRLTQLGYELMIRPHFELDRRALSKV